MEIVCGWKLTAGSNPVLCANKKGNGFAVSFLFIYRFLEQDLRVGAILREQNALPKKVPFSSYLTTKTTIGNCRAGRAAKGANPVVLPFLFLFVYRFLEQDLNPRPTDYKSVALPLS